MKDALIEYYLFFTIPVLLSGGVAYFCFREPPKIFKIEYKENSVSMPLHSSTMIGARSAASAVKKFNRKYGRVYSVQNVIEVREQK
ncbi:MAG: hypothetical protein UGF89_01890 [Acutalibacteraceae bacterium]|nr:hypothetical protein [Acutalibacteraceae bacterium]